jgi:fibronectin-binding autotransporter adhesin
VRRLIFILGFALASHNFAFAAPVLITEAQGGGLGSAIALDSVFGAGNYNSIGSYSGIDTSSVFSASNSFVFLDGGNNTDSNLSSFLISSGAAILNWVSNGGSLFIQSGGWSESIDFGPATISWSPSSFNFFGDLTSEGAGALNSFGVIPSNYIGFALASTMIIGNGLTSFLDGITLDNGSGETAGGGSIMAGVQYGSGYIMYSGLTDTDPNMAINDAAPLLASAVAYTAAQGGQTNIPEPISLALLGVALCGIAWTARKRKQ